jgi:hypothetical protein
MLFDFAATAASMFRVKYLGLIHHPDYTVSPSKIPNISCNLEKHANFPSIMLVPSPVTLLGAPRSSVPEH